MLVIIIVAIAIAVAVVVVAVVGRSCDVNFLNDFANFYLYL